MSFALGLMIGVELGLIVAGFLAIGAYDRGYDAAERRRAARRLQAQPRPVARPSSKVA